MKITLTITKGEFAGKSYDIDNKAIIGRSPKTQIFIDNELVSRKHAEIFVKDGVVFIKDLKSSGGTFVNSQPISEPRKLKSRDKIRIANTILEIKILRPKKTKEKTSLTSPKLGRTLSDIVRSDTEQIEITDVLSASEKKGEKLQKIMLRLHQARLMCTKALEMLKKFKNKQLKLLQNIGASSEPSRQVNLLLLMTLAVGLKVYMPYLQC